jgi:hypothetical protein
VRTPEYRTARRTLRKALLILIGGAAYSMTLTVVAKVTSPARVTFASFVDDYLDHFGGFHPSIAAGNGLHRHYGELEDFAAASIAKELRWLHATRNALDTFDDRSLVPDEQVDRRILKGIACARSSHRTLQLD